MTLEVHGIATRWSDLVIRELVRCGVHTFCLSSGARSGLLATSVGRTAGTNPVMHFDERASAFYALGHAKATRRPVAWITTSGTAVANGLPAIIEAAQDHVPLILLTADRPPELRATGANQAIDQVKLFGSYVRWFFDLPCPDPALSPAFVLSTVDQAVFHACQSPEGPVHLNLMFREPLTPATEICTDDVYNEPIRRWMANDRPWTEQSVSSPRASVGVLDAWSERIAAAENGLLVIGRLNDESEREAARALAMNLGWPVHADVLSGLRLGVLPHRIAHADQVLLGKAAQGRTPDLILHIGGTLVSKRWVQWIASRNTEYRVIKSHTERQDPMHHANAVLVTDLSAWVNVSAPRGKRAADDDAWKREGQRVLEVLSDEDQAAGSLDEIAVARIVSSALPSGHGLFLSNSMPVRDMDMFAVESGMEIAVSANRGASGIDGVIASACGWTQGMQRPVTLVIGDLAFLHDLNALHYLSLAKFPVTMVVINNDGGGIFSFLPMAATRDVFEPFFGTPHGRTFEPAAALFDLAYAHPEDGAGLRAALEKAWASGRSSILEVRTDRTDNVARHRTVQQRIQQALAEA